VLQFMENGVSQSPAGSNGTGKGSTSSGSSSLPARRSTITDRSSLTSPEDRPLRSEANFNDTNGLLDVNGAETNYVDSSHWLSVLNEIKEVREYLQPGNVAREVLNVNGPGAEASVDLVFGPVQPLQLAEIVRSVPPRHVCDSLLSYYFNTKYMIMRTYLCLRGFFIRDLLTLFSNRTSYQISERGWYHVQFPNILFVLISP
jgi:hypothetical protein